MGKIIINGTFYTGSSDKASHIIYNNSSSGLIANNIQDAIDELKKKILGLSGGAERQAYPIYLGENVYLSNDIGGLI